VALTGGGAKAAGEGIHPRRAATPWFLLAPGLAWLAFFFVFPLVELGRVSLENGGFSNYADAFEKNGTVIGRTFVYAFFATIFAIIIGYPLAYFIAMRAGKYKTLMLSAVVVPFFVTYLIRTLAWKILLYGEGPVAGFFRWTGLLSKDGQILSTPGAVIGALVYNFLPFMVLPIYVSLDKIDRRLLEAAPDLYADGRRTFLKIVLPLSLPGVFAGSLLTFIPACGDFVNADLLGGDRQQMIGNIISNNFSNPTFRPTMSALSFVLMVLILMGVLLYAKVLGTDELA
jgi:spermidine/putrescine transport system permease protein